MREMAIRPGTQALVVFGMIAAIGAAIVVQLPELQRYLKVRKM